jgi:heme/copper-type cytochrome/quinol oxidase subunit 2
MTGLSFFPEQASTEAPHTDFIYFILIGFSLVVTAIVVGLLVVFAIRYRRGSEAKRGELRSGSSATSRSGGRRRRSSCFCSSPSGPAPRGFPR